MGNPGSWVDTAGRSWRTECDTPLTGRNVCRSWTYGPVVVATRDARGYMTYSYVNLGRLNNIVRFS